MNGHVWCPPFRAVGHLHLQWARPFGLVIACTLALAASGCRIMAPKYKVDSKVHSEQDIAANSQQIRLRMRAQVQPLTGVIVAAADQIIAGTTNRAIRRQALLWKIDAVPALREALFLPNPMAAVFDAWAMTFQMTDYFERGPGKGGLGDAQAIAVTTCQHLETELARLAASCTVSGDVSKARAAAKQWAADHPIRQSTASRESTLNRDTEMEVATSFSTTEAMGNLTVTLDDLNRRLEIYSAQLLDQARWQAELFAMDTARDYQVEKAIPLAERAVKLGEQAVTAVDRLAPAVERVAAVAENAPKILAAERDVTIKALQTELSRSLNFVQEERIAALKHITAERIAAVQDMRDAVVQERKTLMQNLDQMSIKVVNQAFQRAAQLCAVVLVVLFAFIILLLFLVRRMFCSRTTGPQPE
jgi:hypothetical protein